MEIQPDFAGLERMLNATVKQVYFAAARTVTILANEIKDAEIANEKARLDRPRPFTTTGIRTVGASGRVPVAKVFVMDITARYLDPYEKGGTNVLNSRALLKPVAKGALPSGGSLLDNYGNIPDGTLDKLRARRDVFVGTVKTKIGDVNGVWQRATDEGKRTKVEKLKRVKKIDPKTGKLRTVREKTGAFRSTAKGGNATGRLKLLVRFTDAHPIADKNRLHWFKTAQDLIDKRAPAVLSEQLIRAIDGLKT